MENRIHIEQNVGEKTKIKRYQVITRNLLILGVLNISQNLLHSIKGRGNLVSKLHNFENLSVYITQTLINFPPTRSIILSFRLVSIFRRANKIRSFSHPPSS